MTENLIIFNARVVTPIGFSARCGKEMGELCIIDNATIEVTDGIISYVGPSRGEMRDGYYQMPVTRLRRFAYSLCIWWRTCRRVLLAIERRKLYVYHGAWWWHCKHCKGHPRM